MNIANRSNALRTRTVRPDSDPVALVSTGSESRRSSRRGFSLMEVIVATAILMGSAIVLARLAGMGQTQAAKAALASEAQRLCEDTLNEVVLGLRPLEQIEDAPLLPVVSDLTGQLEERLADDDLFSRSTPQTAIAETAPRWLYFVRTAPLPQVPEITVLTIGVTQADTDITTPVTYQLTRWVRIDESSTTNDAFAFPEGSLP